MFPTRPPKIEDIEGGTASWEDVDKQVSYDKHQLKWVFEAEDGEYFYDYQQDKWVPSNERKRKHKDNESDNESVAEKENRETIKRIKKERLAEMREEIKRLKAAAGGTGGGYGGGSSGSAVEASSSLAVYVTQLPVDVTVDELTETFEKYGVITEDIKGEKRVKLYYDEEGRFKREALIIYVNGASAQMAIDMLNGVYLRGPVRDKEPINVQFARLKKEDKAKVQLSEEDKRKLQIRKQELKRKLTDWDDEDNSRIEDTKKKILAKQIVISNMFRKQELKKDSLLEQDIKEDILEECQAMGISLDLNKITVYDESGVVVVKFHDTQLASQCLTRFNGRYYDGLELAVSTSTGERYNRSEDAQSEEGRLESFGKWIETTE